ncbi:MAG: prolyl oligopeptidase family serine peptidase, partial [Dongiaceae bacterium]
KRGTPLEAADTLFEAKTEDVWAFATRDHTKGYERDFVLRGITFYSNEMFLRRDGKLVKIEKPDTAKASVHRDLLLLELRDDWTVAGRTYPAGALLATDFEAFLKGERRFDMLFEPSNRRSLAGYSPTLNNILVNELDNVKNRVHVLSRKEGEWTREPLPGMPEFGTVVATAVDDDDSDDYFLTVTDYVTPTSLSMGTVAKGAPEKLKQLPAFFDAAGLAVSQHETASTDGTRVPYFQVSRKNLALDGKNPTLLYGYGGFDISLTPSYSAAVAAWLERGGIYAVPNLRGGGEYGADWHDAGTRTRKQNVFDDFIAAAEWLIANRYTSTPRLAIHGRSNGGLLVGAVMAQRPDLFGAALPGVGVMDMLRYHTASANAYAWSTDYGTVEDANEFRALAAYSPVHNLKSGRCYPPTLVTTADHDDRVVPWHSFKFTAALQYAQGCGSPVIVRIETRAGHGAGKPTWMLVEDWANQWSFLVKHLGMPGGQ